MGEDDNNEIISLPNNEIISLPNNEIISLPNQDMEVEPEIIPDMEVEPEIMPIFDPPDIDATHDKEANGNDNGNDNGNKGTEEPLDYKGEANGEDSDSESDADDTNVGGGPESGDTNENRQYPRWARRPRQATVIDFENKMWAQ